MGIEWKDDAVCFAGGRYWSALGEGYSYLVDDKVIGVGFKYLIECPDFQLNTIKQGDYIEASELDRQKYQNAVGVFKLFGFYPYERCYKKALKRANEIFFVSDDLLFIGSSSCSELTKRKITFNQLMAIGELKRLELERDKEPQFGKNEDGSMKLIKSNFSASSNKYEREITDRQGNSATVDVYDVLKAFEVTCPATQHALKKLLCSGLRGHKDLQTDLLEAKESITRAIELNE